MDASLTGIHRMQSGNDYRRQLIDNIVDKQHEEIRKLEHF